VRLSIRCPEQIREQHACRSSGRQGYKLCRGGDDGRCLRILSFHPPTPRTMPYEMTRKQTGDSGERQPAISPLPTVSSLPELNEVPVAQPAPARTTPQRPSISYKPTPAPIVPTWTAYVPPPRPSRWTIIRRKFSRGMSCDCYALRNCMNCSPNYRLVFSALVSPLPVERCSLEYSTHFCRCISDYKWLTGSGSTTTLRCH